MDGGFGDGAITEGRLTLEVLVIDDEIIIGRVIERLLGQRAEVTTLTSGSAARKAVAGQKYDLIFCDVHLPDSSGAELYRRLAADDWNPQKRMIFLTGGFFDEKERKFFDDLDNPLVFKPFGVEELEDAVAAVIGE